MTVSSPPGSIVVDRNPTPFDEMAPDFDRLFGDNLIVNLMRQAVWRRIDALFLPGRRVLELNCGTGEDAVHLARRGVRVLATDISAPMVQVAADKVTDLGLRHMIDVRRVPAEEIGSCRGENAELFDGAFSNFGGLNCVEDLANVGAQLAACLRPGATAVLCIMGPYCPWEWLWYLGKRRPAKAFRRLSRGGTPWHGMTIYYPSVRDAGRAFAPHFRMRRVCAVGALLPPTYVEDWARKHPGLVRTLDRWERRIEAWWPLPQLADHYLLEVERL